MGIAFRNSGIKSLSRNFQDFMLEKLKPEESEMEIQVKKIVHQAFWDVLKLELSEDPPVFHRALSLLEDVRTALVFFFN